jgi:predicted NBD/HSP70 family sugar kinase
VIGLDGDVQKSERIEVNRSTPEDIFQETVKVYNSLVSCLDRRKIIGLGVGIPGLIDPKNRMVIFSAVLGWRDVSVDEFLSIIDVPLFIEDNVRAITLGELWYGAGIGKENLLCIGAGRGISAGIVIDGAIYSGPNDRAGEFGHMVIEKDGKKCKCGNYGCLEPYVSTETIIEKVLEGIENNAYTRFSPKDEDRLFEEIVQAGKEGDKFILNIFEEVGEYLGIGIANIINFFNPELIILADELSKAGDLILDPVKRAIRLHALPPIPEIVISKLGSLACAVGSATLAVKELLYSKSDQYIALMGR